MYSIAQYLNQLTEQDKKQVAELERLIDERLSTASGEIIKYPLTYPPAERVRNKIVEMYGKGGWTVKYLEDTKPDNTTYSFQFTLPKTKPSPFDVKD